MEYLQAYREHFKMMIYIVVFIIFFGLAMFLITQGTITRQTIDAYTP